MTDLTRRRFLGAMLAVAAAPMIVRASSLMAHVPVKPARQNLLNTAFPDFDTANLRFGATERYAAGWRRFTVTGIDQRGNRVVETISLSTPEPTLVMRTTFRRIDSVAVGATPKWAQRDRMVTLT